MSKSRRIATTTVTMGVFLLAACGGGGGSGPTVIHPAPEPQPEPVSPPSPTTDPAYHLNTVRFTTHQPGVLEQVGAHHAYAMGLTGKGVRIGVDDTVVDYTQGAEFGSRVKLLEADGASFSYSHPFGDEPFSDVDRCRLHPACRYWTGDSEGDPEALNRWVRQIVDEEGWPTRDDTVFIVDEHYSDLDPLERLFRWSEVPTPYGEGAHGTVVASVAAGRNLGVAPEATIVPIAQNLTDDQRAEAYASAVLRSLVPGLPIEDRHLLDEVLAGVYRDQYAKFDIINRSYGARTSELAIVNSIESAQWFQRYLPQTLDALWQTDSPDAEKTILVYAAGNDGAPGPGLGALDPYYFPELRGHSVAVVATDPSTGGIAGYSNRCGPVPSGWNSARYGPHYCLSAPGTVRGLVPNPSTPGSGDARSGLHGTSYAAPLVSGALALMMEHFRGTRGNSEIVKRMIDTADRNGTYADPETYGAGHLDLEAALSPVGALSAGPSAHALSRTTLQTPAAFGSVAQRVAGYELAAFDEQGFPFWVPLSGLISGQSDDRTPIPEIRGREVAGVPATGLGALGLHWTTPGDAGGLPFPEGRDWMMGFSASSASLARLPHDGGWGYGLSFDGAGYLGSGTSGAFGSDLRSGMIWTSRAWQGELGEGWTLNIEGTLALSMPQYQEGAIFSASSSVMFALSMRIGTDSAGLTVEQPLRAESGTGTFRVENGQIKNGRKLYDEHRVPLRPDAREVRMSLRHEREAPGGRVAVEVAQSMNSGHVPGESETRIGLAYRTTW